MFRKIRSNVGVLMVFAVGFGLFFSGGTAFSQQTDSVVLEVGADTAVVENGGDRKIVVRVLVRPSERSVSHRVPLAVALVLDRSGSMASDRKMENAKLGALEALKMLGERDVATIVVYDSAASVFVRARTVGRGAEEPAFRRAISRLEPGGMTALYDGVVLGAEQLEPFVAEGFVPRIVLLSDGIANVGPSSTQELARLGRSLARREMTITTIGLGLDYHEDLMTALAAESGGNAYFARTSRMLPEIFSRDMEDAVTLTARRVRVAIRGLDGARPIRAIGRTGSISEETLEVSIDNLYGGEKYALFEFEIPAGEAGTVSEAAEVVLEYVDPLEGKTLRQMQTLRISFTDDASEVEKNRRTDIASQTAFARNAEIREEAVRLVDEGKVQEAARMLTRRTGELRMMAPSAGEAAPAMERESGYFEELADGLLSLGGFSNTMRKEVLSDAYMQKTQQALVHDRKTTESGDVSEDDEEEEEDKDEDEDKNE